MNIIINYNKSNAVLALMLVELTKEKLEVSRCFRSFGYDVIHVVNIIINYDSSNTRAVEIND